MISDNVNYISVTVSDFNINNVQKNDTLSDTDELIETDKSENNEKIQDYLKLINDAVESELLLSECKPSSESILIWDKTYKDDGYICTEHKGWGNKKTIIKAKDDSLIELAGDIIFGMQPEKIIEEYDKNKKLYRQTEYDKFGNCIVTLFNPDGSKKEELKITNKEYNSCEYKTELKHTYYNNSGTCVMTTEIEMNESCTDGNPQVTTTAEYYKPDGSADYVSQFIYELIFNTDKDSKSL